MKALKTLSEAYVMIGALIAPPLLTIDLIGYNYGCALGVVSAIIAGYALQT